MVTIKQKIVSLREKYHRLEPAVFFAAGFLFDVITLNRIDDWLKLFFQILFLVLLAWFLVLENRSVTRPEWTPPAFLTKIWPYRLDIVHFLFGSLLSAYVIFYFKSTSATRSVIFLFLLVLLLFLNEVPQVRRLGVPLRAALYSFCLSSFFIYFFPLLAGRLAAWLFVAGIFCSTLLSLALVYFLAKDSADPRDTRLKLGWPVLVIQGLLLIAYAAKAIPPVPLSVRYAGIFHKVEKEGTDIKLFSLKPWYDFWSHGERAFKSRAQEPIYCFVRVFAPGHFSHQIFLNWNLLDERSGNYLSQDRIGMQISGGREAGFRGFSFKSHYQPGKWRVDIETEDGRVIGSIYFSVEEDLGQEDRIWMIEEG